MSKHVCASLATATHAEWFKGTSLKLIRLVFRGENVELKFSTKSKTLQLTESAVENIETYLRNPFAKFLSVSFPESYLLDEYLFRLAGMEMIARNVERGRLSSALFLACKLNDSIDIEGCDSREGVTIRLLKSGFDLSYENDGNFRIVPVENLGNGLISDMHLEWESRRFLLVDGGAIYQILETSHSQEDANKVLDDENCLYHAIVFPHGFKDCDDGSDSNDHTIIGLSSDETVLLLSGPSGSSGHYTDKKDNVFRVILGDGTNTWKHG